MISQILKSNILSLHFLFQTANEYYGFAESNRLYARWEKYKCTVSKTRYICVWPEGTDRTDSHSCTLSTSCPISEAKSGFRVTLRYFWGSVFSSLSLSIQGSFVHLTPIKITLFFQFGEHLIDARKSAPTTPRRVIISAVM